MKKVIKLKRKKYKHNNMFIFFVFITILFLIYNYLDNKNLKLGNKKTIKLLIQSIKYDNKPNIKINYKLNNPDIIINSNYKNLVSKRKTINKISYSNKDPLIYIYNTHQTEEYRSKDYIESNVKPTVFIADYILEDLFNKNNYPTIVEERKIKDVLSLHNWNYSHSYQASRMYMIDSKESNNSLRYFIDVHRDSLGGDKTTTIINNKRYAKVLFIVGLENNNYNSNLEFSEKINDKLNEKYPSLSKGIYKKAGAFVNGVYNQDFSPYVILIEIGGKDNTVDEVLNSTLAFGECFMEVISNEK